MLKVQARLTDEKRLARLVLQVHDELVLEAPDAEVEVVGKLVQEEMAGIWQLKVPLSVDVGHGVNWAEAH